MADCEVGIIDQDLLVRYYDNGVTDGIYSGKMKGMDEFREAVLYYLNMTVDEQIKVFGSNCTYTNLSTHYSNEFIEKINQYKELFEQKIKVGDYVRDISDILCIVTNIDTHIHVIYPNGKTHKWPKNSRFTKTGCTAPVFLDAMKVFQEFKENME